MVASATEPRPPARVGAEARAADVAAAAGRASGVKPAVNATTSPPSSRSTVSPETAAGSHHVARAPPRCASMVTTSSRAIDHHATAKPRASQAPSRRRISGRRPAAFQCSAWGTSTCRAGVHARKAAQTR
ncbi:hypothetical protein ASF82_09370 [Frigoribacterium sp. Leaf164]|nr:hypothetical protein ASF82_09370 [Frigoribacterium sp. Leaf164]